GPTIFGVKRVTGAMAGLAAVELAARSCRARASHFAHNVCFVLADRKLVPQRAQRIFILPLIACAPHFYPTCVAASHVP
ncbi:MAG TPA: hypothetical protein VKC57_01710, partial [Ktedonobacterales bacterium]|nr:hypothetical protein [Ktedonobacterales bacterium]